MACLTRCIHHEIDSFKVIFLKLTLINCAYWNGWLGGRVGRLSWYCKVRAEDRNSILFEVRRYWGKNPINYQQLCLPQSLKRINTLRLFLFRLAKCLAWDWSMGSEDLPGLRIHAFVLWNCTGFHHSLWFCKMAWEQEDPEPGSFQIQHLPHSDQLSSSKDLLH